MAHHLLPEQEIRAATSRNAKKRHCQELATLIAEKVDDAVRHVRQIELCADGLT
jgi:hypothetical protein